MESLTPAEIAAKYAAAGEGKAKRATSLLVVLGILAGALIALGSAATNTAVYGIEEVWTARTICGLLFPFGLGMVVIMGAELFTGNCLITISVLDRRCTVGQMLRSWVIVYLSNLVGSLLVAAGCNYIMGVPEGDDCMLMYQCTGYHEAAALREVFGLRPIHEFDMWLEKMGFSENGKLTPKAGDASVFLKK